MSNLPTPAPNPPAHRVVQLVNCSTATLLGAANAAGKVGQPLTSVFPREQTWVMEPVGTGKNVLTIDIPPAWEATVRAGTGPRLWARTGCRYDIASGRAQCETGVCVVNMIAAPQSLEHRWALPCLSGFYEPNSNGNISYFKDSPDISAVDGANLNMDIQPVGGSPHNPFDALGGHDIQWLAENYPLTKEGEDLQINARPLLRKTLGPDGKVGG